jgi:hypothetical protein
MLIINLISLLLRYYCIFDWDYENFFRVYDYDWVTWYFNLKLNYFLKCNAFVSGFIQNTET